MFGKRSSNSTTVIGRGARFVGTLELEGPIHIEGNCEGAIRAQGELSIGPQGSVLGEVTGNVVTIAGRVEGTVVANQSLRVLPTGGLKGDVYYGRLQVDSGGIIDGRSHQGSPPPALGAGEPESEYLVEEQSGVVETRPQPTSVFPVVGETGGANAAGLR